MSGARRDRLQRQEEVVAPDEDHRVLDLAPGDLRREAGELVADHVGGGRVAPGPVVGEPGVARLAPAPVRERPEVHPPGGGQDLDPAPRLGAVGRVEAVLVGEAVPQRADRPQRHRRRDRRVDGRGLDRRGVEKRLGASPRGSGAGALPDPRPLRDGMLVAYS